jgi:hypothetical protein
LKYENHQEKITGYIENSIKLIVEIKINFGNYLYREMSGERETARTPKHAKGKYSR